VHFCIIRGRNRRMMQLCTVWVRNCTRGAPNGIVMQKCTPTSLPSAVDVRAAAA
jgi:hypothetical protein